MADGIGCVCAARSEGECCCDGVDWTPQELIDLRKECATLKYDLLKAGALAIGYAEKLAECEKERDAARNESEMGKRMCRQLMGEISGLNEALQNRKTELAALKQEATLQAITDIGQEIEND